MDSSSTQINVCKLQETNEMKIEETYKVINQKLIQVQQECNTLKIKFRNSEHETALLEKEEYCLESKNKILEEEIAFLKSQTEEAASSVELSKWKIYKLELIKEFEQKCNEPTYKIINEKKESLDHIPLKTMEISEIHNDEKETKSTVTEIKKKISQLKKEIEGKKKNIQMTDPKLLTNMTILEKRNAALLLRYQRQLGEATSRYRQTLTEVNSLKRILAERNSLHNEKSVLKHK